MLIYAISCKNLVKIYNILKTELSVPDHIYVIIDYNTIARPVEEYLAPHTASIVQEVVTVLRIRDLQNIPAAINNPDYCSQR